MPLRVFEGTTHNLPIRSFIPLPGTTATSYDRTTPFLNIREGPVPQRLDEHDAAGVAYECTPERVLVRLPNGGRLLIDGADEIRINAGESSIAALQLFLLNVAVPLVLHRRRRLVLHAAAVEIEGRTFALLGASGSGKSTLALALARRGHAVLSDEVVAMRTDDGHPPAAATGPRCLQVWHDVLARFDVETDDLQAVRPGLQKYYYSLPDRPLHEQPIDTLFLLHSAHVDEVHVEPMTGKETLEALLHHTHRYEYLPGMGLLAPHVALCTRVVEQVCMHRLVCPHHRPLEHQDALCRTLEHAAAA